jgi:hypothetical protein
MWNHRGDLLRNWQRPARHATDASADAPERSPEANRVAQAIDALDPLIELTIGILTDFTNMPDAHRLRDVVFT